MTAPYLNIYLIIFCLPIIFDSVHNKKDFPVLLLLHNQMHIASYGIFYQRRFSDDVQHKKQRQRYLLATFFVPSLFDFFIRRDEHRGRPKVL